ncbi:hypothetical protein ACUBYX_000113 [Providencia rettgeri]
MKNNSPFGGQSRCVLRGYPVVWECGLQWSEILPNGLVADKFLTKPV